MIIRFAARDSVSAFELASAIDKAHGFPRDHERGEPGVEWNGRGTVPHTESLCEVLADASGNIAVHVDDAWVDAIRGQVVEIRDAEGQAKQVTVTDEGADRQRLTNASRSGFPDRRPPRGGLDGSEVTAKGRSR